MNKKTLKLGGVLIILIALAYIYQGPLQNWRNNSGKPKNFLAKVDANQIDKIEIAKSEKTTILEKYDNKWKIGGAKDFYVQQDAAESLIKGLQEAAKAELDLISESKEKKSEFQTDKENGVHVKLIQGGRTAADFIVGKRAMDFTSAYISQPESDNTYAIKADLYGVFGRSDWHEDELDKKIEDLKN